MKISSDIKHLMIVFYPMDNQKLLIQSVDFFTPIVDDPYDFGRIAAANSFLVLC